MVLILFQLTEKSVFTRDDVITALRVLFDSKADTVSIEFAPERHMDAKLLHKAIVEHDLFQPNEPEAEHVPVLSIADIRTICEVQYPDYDFSEQSISAEEINLVISAIKTHETLEEQAIGHFTRRKLKTLSTWPEWQKGERKQLDRMESLGMYGPPVQRPRDSILLRLHWQYHVKRDGTRRSHNCCDGSPRAAPILHKMAATYSSCVAQPIQRLFFALAASQGYRVYGGDATDAFAHSPPPDSPTFVAIDDAYAEWYEDKYKKKLDRSLVLPVLHALQGHPESGRLWEEHINAILLSEDFGFKPTTHDRSIYSAIIDGEIVLLLRQVDDFAIACSREEIAADIYDRIGKRLQLPSEAEPPFHYFGLLDDYNGIDVRQTSDTIELSCPRYIRRVLATHMWSAEPASEPTKPISPLPGDAITQMYSHTGPPEGTPEYAALARKHGFSYRTLLGELLYAYVTCRPDIGYAVVTLSKFSTCPHDVHYALLKKVAKYLRSEINWAIIYKKPKTDPSLPKSTHPRLSADPEFPDFPLPKSLTDLVCFVDAAHANELKKRRSTTGYTFMLAGGVVSYRCKTQSITTTSSTEAEFLAAVLAAKQARYLRSVMRELGFYQKHPTCIYDDNKSAIQMINARVPTDRSRHIDIQHFAIQDWKDAGDIIMHHILLTKPLGWILHERHARRLMGHYY